MVSTIYIHHRNQKHKKLWLWISYCIFSCYSFQHKLQDIFKDVHETYAGIDGRLKAEQFKVQQNV